MLLMKRKKEDKNPNQDKQYRIERKEHETANNLFDGKKYVII